MLERSPARIERPQEFDSVIRHQLARYGVWALLVLLAMTSVLWVLGRGPISTKHVQSGVLGASYSGTGRVHRPLALELTLGQTRAASQAMNAREVSTQEVWFSREYLNRLTVLSISPEPLEIRNEGNLVAYVFAGTNLESQKVRFDLEFERMGIYSGWVSLNSGDTLELRQWIYP